MPKAKSTSQQRKKKTFKEPAIKNVKLISFHSRALKTWKKANLLLPGNYYNTKQHYSVLYLLHGYGGNKDSWLKNTNLSKEVGKHRLIIVLPESGRRWFINDYERYRYEDYFVNELIPHIDSHFRTIPSREGRAIAGFSMGGAVAFIQAFRYPELFSIAVSHGGAFDAPRREGDPYKNIRKKDKDLVMPTTKMHERVWGPNKKDNRVRKEYNLYRIIEEFEKEFSLELYIDVGGSDYKRVVRMNRDFHNALDRLDICHEYHEYVGAKHDWEYLGDRLKDSLKFISNHISKPLHPESIDRLYKAP